MTFLEGQILNRFAYVLSWHAKVVSGAYKQRMTQKATGTAPDGSLVWRDCTEEEKLADAVATLERHCDTLLDLTDSLPTTIKDDSE